MKKPPARALVRGVGSLAEGECRVDWFRATGPEWAGQAFIAWATERWGLPERRPGRWGYAHRDQWGTGATLNFGAPDGSERVTVEMPGEVCAEFTLPEFGQVIQRLWSMGFRSSSRVDLAVDIRGDHLELIERMREAGQVGNYAGVRKHRAIDQRSGGRVTGEGVEFGRREGDGTMLRVYDKGLESGTAGRGEWVRVEVQECGKRGTWAAELLHAAALRDAGVWHVDGRPTAGQLDLVAADPDRYGSVRDVLLGIVAGAVDFIDRATGSRRRDRAQRLDWWSGFLEEARKLIAPAVRRGYKSLWSFQAWVERCVWPSLWAMAERAGVAVEDVAALLGLHETPAAERPSAAVLQFATVHSGRSP